MSADIEPPMSKERARRPRRAVITDDSYGDGGYMDRDEGPTPSERGFPRATAAPPPPTRRGARDDAVSKERSVKSGAPAPSAASDGGGSIWRFALLATLLWIGGVGAFAAGFFQLRLSPISGLFDEAMQLPPHLLLMTCAVMIAPLGLIWLSAMTARRAAALKHEAAQLRAQIANGAGAGGGSQKAGAAIAAMQESARLRDEAEAATKAVSDLEVGLAAAAERADLARERLRAEQESLAELLHNVERQGGRPPETTGDRGASAGVETPPMGLEPSSMLAGATGQEKRAPEPPAPEPRAPEPRLASLRAPERRTAPRRQPEPAREPEPEPEEQSFDNDPLDRDPIGGRATRRGARGVDLDADLDPGPTEPDPYGDDEDEDEDEFTPALAPERRSPEPSPAIGGRDRGSQLDQIDALRRRVQGGGRADPPAAPAPSAPPKAPSASPVAAAAAAASDAPAGGLDWNKLVKAANFPESEEDHETLDALYSVLTDPEAAALLQAAEDALSALADAGLYMEDMQPHHAPTELWRAYAVEGQRRDVMDLGGVRDPDAIEDATEALRSKPEFNAVAERFMDRYETVIERLFSEGPDATMAVELADTRSGRAYMLLARASGRFG